MKLPTITSRDGLLAVTTIGLAAVFIYAGLDKVQDPLHFADSINAFDILPHGMIDALALGLPLYEIGCAVLILLPPTRRAGALALTLASAMFFLALLSALLRGLTLDCGCFGTGVPSRPRMWAELALDTLLVIGSALIYLPSILKQT